MFGCTVFSYLQEYQPILIFPLLTIARLSWALSSILWNYNSKRVLEFPSLRNLERGLLVVHYIWYLGSAFYFLDPIYAVFWALSCQIFCGLFLSTVFSLNHVLFIIYFRMEDLFTLLKMHQK